MEVKGIAVKILNVLVNATRYHGETETADQNSGLVDLRSRKGKGRAANGDRQVGAASCKQEQQTQGDMPKPPHPTHDVDCPHTGAFGAWNAPSVQRRRHANDPAPRYKDLVQREC